MICAFSTMKFPLICVALISLNVGFAMAGASIEPRFKRDVVDSHKEDMDKLAKLDKNLNFMTHLGSLKKNGGQRRSDEITTVKPVETTVPAQPVAPQARMSDDTRTTSSTTSTTTSTTTTTTASTTTASSATVASSTIKPTSGTSKDGLRECLHPKDVNCQKAGKPVNLSVGIVHR